MKKLTVCLLLSICMAATAAGCGEKEKKTESTAQEVQEVKEEVQEEKEYQIVGNKTEDAYDLLLKNSTGQDITAITVKSSDMAAYPGSMLANGAVIKNGDTVEFFYTPESAGVQQTTETGTDKAVNLVYTVHLTFADGSMYELSSFGLDDMEKEGVELCLEEGVVFVKYTSKANETAVSTKEQELGMKAYREAEAARLAQEEAARQEAARQEAARQEAARQAAAKKKQQSQKQPQKQQAPAQSSDGCLDGVAIN